MPDSLENPQALALPRLVFVTGINGFIGSALAERYRSLGVEVTGVDAVPGAGAGIEGDVSRPGEWQEAARHSDLFVHTAALVSNSAPIERCWQVNVAAVRHVLDAAVNAAANRFVHLSSVRAFSDVDFPDGVTERFPVRPDGHRYVDTKVASEQVVLQAHAAQEVSCTIIRPGDVYGPGSKPWTLWPVFGMTSDSFFVPDSGEHIFSPVYVDNLVDGIVLAAASEDADGEVFTISDGVGVTNRDFFGHYARMLGVELPLLPADDIRKRFAELEQADLEAGREPLLNAETVDYLLRTGTYSIDKAREVLGYEPEVGLTEGMVRTQTWLDSLGLLPPDP